MQRRLGKRMLSLLLVMLAVTTACEKKRKSRYVQGDGEYVYAINDFKGATYTLKTGKKRTPGVTTRADELVVPEGSNVIRSFNSVDFELETDIGDFTSKTMNNFDFYGKEDTEYKIQLDFTEEKLVFFEIAKKDELPTNELTYAEDIGNGLYRVPLFGLPLDKVTVERIKDDRGKSTNQIRTFSKKFLSEATHFLVNVNTPSYFESQLKLDMLPSSFFDEKNEWFYELTVVDKPIALDSSEIELGYQLGSGKIRFAKTNNSVLLVDTNIADEAVGQDAEKLNVVFEIPVQWMDYRLVKTGDSAYLKEEAFDSIEEGARFWKDRDHALLQLDRVLAIDAASTNNIKIKRLEVSEDYFSFIIYDSLTKYSLHYSFAKKNEVVPGKIYPIDDFRKFGFFESNKELYSGQLNSTEGALAKSRVQNRMIPPNRTVTFHISNNTPQDPIFLEAIQEAINGWNWAFAEAAKGTQYESDPIKVVLDLSKPVQNGDARYHKVSFYGYEVESGLLGYGPSVTDNRNGEIYSSTNHIYLRNYRESIISNLVNYVRYKLGAYGELDIDGVAVPEQILAVQSNGGYDFGSASGGTAIASTTGQSNLFSAPLDLSASVGGDKVFAPKNESNLRFDRKAAKLEFDASFRAEEKAAEIKSLANRLAQGVREKRYVRSSGSQPYQGFLQARRKLENGMISSNQFQTEMAATKKADPKSYEQCDMLAATSLTFKEIEDVCGAKDTEFSDYVEELQGRVKSGEKIYRLDTERDVLLACAQKLMKPTLIATLAHEFGHNFGLRHNFIGSADPENFAKNEAGVPESRMSSVMDYSHADADRGTRPGPYDIAAIRYGYYNAIEATDGSFVDVTAKDQNDLRTVEQRVKDADSSKTMRPFKFCTDDHIIGYPYVQIGMETSFCERWDQGADPIQKVRAGIDTLITSLVTRGSRFDMQNSSTPNGLAFSAIGRSMGGVRNVYDEYRVNLHTMAKARGNKFNNPYFDVRTDDSNPEVTIEREVLGAEYDVAVQLVKDLRANPTMSTEELDNRSKNLSQMGKFKVAAEIAKDFFLQIAFTESQYCVALHNNRGNYEFVDAESLSLVRNNNFTANRIDSTKCEDAIDYFKNKVASSVNNDMTVDKVISVGNPFDNISYSANPLIIADHDDVRTGIGLVRELALGLMSPRNPVAGSIFNSITGGAQYVPGYTFGAIIQMGILASAQAGFTPSMLDSAEYRAAYLKKTRARLVDGVKVDDLVKFANAKLQKLEGRSVSAPLVFKGRSLPYYAEETYLLQDAWLNYRYGAPSPTQNTNQRTQSVDIQQLQSDTFFNFGADSQYTYLVSADGTAYFTRGADAVALINSYNDTNSTLEAIAAKEALELDSSRLAQNIANLNSKVSTVVAGYVDLSTKGENITTLTDLLFQTRICVLNTLVKEYGLSAGEFSSLKEQLTGQGNFEVSAHCGPRADGDKMTTFESSFLEPARKYLDLAKGAKAPINVALVEATLTKVGLPTAPTISKLKNDQPTKSASAADALAAIFKAGDVLGRELGGSEYAAEGLTALEYNIVVNAFGKWDDAIGQDPTAAVDLNAFVEAARVEEFAKLKADAPYKTQLNDKLQLLRNIIFF